MANEITKAKWMTGSYQYQLNLGAKVEDPKGVITPLTLTPAKNVSVKIDNTEYALTLQGVKFSRKIYEPGLIEAEVAISPVMEVENVEELLNMRTARLDLLNTATDATENVPVEVLPSSTIDPPASRANNAASFVTRTSSAFSSTTSASTSFGISCR